MEASVVGDGRDEGAASGERTVRLGAAFAGRGLAEATAAERVTVGAWVFGGHEQGSGAGDCRSVRG